MWLAGLLVALTAAVPAGAPPELVAARYDDAVRFGATTRPGLVLRVRDPDGQVVAITLEGRGVGSVADGGCGLGGRRTGAIHLWRLPTERLRSPDGRQTIDVLLESSPCDGGSAPLESSRRTVQLWVPEPRHRTARVPRLLGRPYSWVGCRLAMAGLRRQYGGQPVSPEPRCFANLGARMSPDPVVRRQDPGAGARVRRGTIVRLEDECSLLRFEPGGGACL
jgi:hypothetical protein